MGGDRGDGRCDARGDGRGYVTMEEAYVVGWSIESTPNAIIKETTKSVGRRGKIGAKIGTKTPSATSTDLCHSIGTVTWIEIGRRTHTCIGTRPGG